MLNACLTFSWLNKVPFDREASGTIRARIYTSARIGADGGYDRDAKSEPKGRCALIPSSRAVPGYCSSRLSHGYLKVVIGNLGYPGRGSMVCVRNKSPAG